MEVNQGELVLCEFFFSDLSESKLRPVLVLKNNLPFEDFVGIPVSSRINKLHADESLLDQSDFSSGSLPKKSKAILRKTFVISKKVVIKKYGALSPESFSRLHAKFCNYFGCRDNA